MLGIASAQVEMRARMRAVVDTVPYGAPLTINLQRKQKLYLPVFLHVDRSVVLFLHGGIAVGLVTAIVVARLVHLGVLAASLMRGPRWSRAFCDVLCRVLRRRALWLDLGGLWLCWRGRYRRRGLVVIVIAERLSALAKGILIAPESCGARREHSQVVEDVLLVVFVGHLGVVVVLVGSDG
jgi:hypothetical protein